MIRRAPVCVALGVLLLAGAAASGQDETDEVDRIRADMEAQAARLREEIARFKAVNEELSQLRQTLTDERDALRAKSDEYDRKFAELQTQREEIDLQQRRRQNEIERQQARLESTAAALWGEASVPEGMTLLQAMADDRDEARADLLAARSRIEELETLMIDPDRPGALRGPDERAPREVACWSDLLADPQTAKMAALFMIQRHLPPARRLDVFESVRQRETESAVRQYATVLLVYTAAQLNRDDLVESLLLEMIRMPSDGESHGSAAPAPVEQVERSTGATPANIVIGGS